MIRLLLVAAFALASCGADGPPEAPSTGVAVTGEAQVGVVIK
jgi:predicted small lipoprotein YifL